MLKRMRLRLVIFFNTLVLLAGFALPAQAVAPAFSFPVARASHALALDPNLSDPAWQAGKVPNDGRWTDVTTRTAVDPVTAYLLYDDKNLYVGFDVKSGGAPIVATQTTNDVGFGSDDFVAIGLDTSGSGSQIYLFETTPKGVRYQQASENSRYRPTWQSATKVDGSNWRAVMVIPLDAMHLRAGASQTWRIGFFRNIASRGEHITWGYDPIMQDAPAGQWPDFFDIRFWPGASGFSIAGSVATRPHPRAELYALGSAGYDHDQYQQSDGSFVQQRTRSVGIDVSYPITPTINFVGTLNPDFSNVEVDQQTIAPQEFARQLNEYRPFFAQGAQYINANNIGFDGSFTAPDEIFYSNSVGPFDHGAKVEGTYGLQSFGLLSFRGYDQVTGDVFDDQAFGYRHAVHDETFQYWADGILAHHSVAGDDETYEMGFKGRDHRTKFVYAYNTDVETGTYQPTGFARNTDAFVGIHQANYQIITGYIDKSPNYGPLDGYTSVSDDHGFQYNVQLNGATNTMKNWALSLNADRLFDASDAVHQADTGFYFNSTFKNGFSINGVGPTVSLLRCYDGNCYTGYPNYAKGVMVPFNLMSLPLGYRDGTPTPIDVAASWGSFNGNWLHYYTASTSRPLGQKFTLGLEYDGSVERSFATGMLDSQWLRRVTLGYNINPQTNLTISLRGINGYGGFVTTPGLNLATGFHTQFKSGDLFINYGSPSANFTLNRLIVKYVFRAGADQGT